MDTRPEQPPEGRLIHDAADRLDLSIREAAKRAGISYGRWRQIVMGYQNVSPGSYATVHAPAKTLAKMARVVGITPAQLTEAGRDDAAVILADLLRPEPAAPESPRELASPADDDMAHNIMVAAARPEERRIWAAIRRRLADTPEGAKLLGSAPQAALWPPETGDGRWGGSPVELTPQAVSVLDSLPVGVLADDAITHAAFRLTEYAWPERVGLAAVMRGRIGRPTVRRAG